MITALAKFIDLLKASGWQTLMLALAAGLFVFLANKEILPTIPDEVIVGAYVVLFVSGALAVAALVSGAQPMILYWMKF